MISVALEMVVPGLIGLWIDRQLGTVMVFLVLGVALGMGVGLFHLVRLAKSVSGAGQGGNRPKTPSKGEGPRQEGDR